MEAMDRQSVSVEFNVPARMRDGVVLRANVYRPDSGGPWPTLLTRLPYGKDLPMIVSRLDPVQTARQGFIVVIQDTRGRFASDGEWDPFVFERLDGYDSVEWAARLPGSDGRVGMYGDSYLGNAQWLAAMERPPSLAAIAPALTWSEPLDGLFGRGGALELGLMVPWSLEQGFDHVARMDLSEAERQRRTQALLDDYDEVAERGYVALPAGPNAVLDAHRIPSMPSVAALDSAEISRICRVGGPEAEIEIPTFHIGGWYDLFIQGTLDNYSRMASRGNGARLLVGPWTHLTFGDPIGQLDFGLRAGRFGFPAHPGGDTAQVQRDWLAVRMSAREQPAETEPPIRIFVMGHNRWRDEESWPPGGCTDQQWFLGPRGDLSPAPPDGGGEPSTFAYDPLDPVPTVGGNTVMAPAFPAGPYDQSSIEARDDVLVFTSEPLEEELEVTGRITLVLYAESSAPSTDWVGRLCDVYPDGRSINLCDGVLRVGDGTDRPRRHEIDLWSTSNVFLPGHRLRVHVTSSSFPRWDRNLNTGDQHTARTLVAHQRVYHGGDAASHVRLPVRAGR